MVGVVDRFGIPLMPTNIKRARKLLKKGRAVIYRHKPIFTIQLLDREAGDLQPVEYHCDTGYQHVGISIVSEKHEYVSAEYTLLNDEPERHRDRRQYRRLRRCRKRYRKPRFDNRKKTKKKGWLAPSIENKMDRQIALFESYKEVLPITSAVFEMGQFDTQVLKAMEEGKPLPEGTDYQHGERYGISTLREAVFTRDDYKCVCCGRGIKQNAILHVHHIGFWKCDRTNRMSNLMTVCEKCHTPVNHKPGGKLYGVMPKLKSFKGATYMTMVRWQMIDKLKSSFPNVQFYFTYGAATKESRRILHLEKTHANDAYAVGRLHPKHRCRTQYNVKCRRNNRILERFYDAKYIDSRDNSVKSGRELFSGRIKRNKNLSGENLHKYRKSKKSKGRRAIRRKHYSLRPGDCVLHQNERYKVVGVQGNGKQVLLDNKKSVAISKVKCLYHCGGWRRI